MVMVPPNALKIPSPTAPVEIVPELIKVVMVPRFSIPPPEDPTEIVPELSSVAMVPTLL